jgi:hypothetical protein
MNHRLVKRFVFYTKGGLAKNAICRGIDMEDTELSLLLGFKRTMAFCLLGCLGVIFVSLMCSSSPLRLIAKELLITVCLGLQLLGAGVVVVAVAGVLDLKLTFLRFLYGDAKK